MSKPTDQPKPDFEQSLKQLETLVERLEQGQLPLQESITLFREGVDAAKQCHAYLNEAQQVVEQLNTQQTAAESEPNPE